MDFELPKTERETQDQLIDVFKNKLKYQFLGNWHDTKRTLSFEENLLTDFLKNKQNYSDIFVKKIIDKFKRISTDLTNGLYFANSETYRLLRYGVNIQQVGEPDQTAWLIDWKNPENNHFAIAEEVTIFDKEIIRPDLIIYVNGIALAIIELKNSQTDIAKAIHQLLRYQKNDATKFFTTNQLLMAGNDLQGIKYGVINANENYFLSWKENTNSKFYTDTKILNLCDNIKNPLHLHAIQLFEKHRFIEIIKDFILFDKNQKKTCRHHQYFGVKSAQKFIKKREGGIIWHTQGSGKSLTMVLLAKWIKENIEKSRVLMLTDRDELDKQLEQVFIEAGETSVERTRNGADLIEKLNNYEPSLICSLVHKFETPKDQEVKYDNSEYAEEESYNNYIAEIKKAIKKDFKPKDDIYVFVDECHRTQSGKLHEAMKLILGSSVFIGFTGTPLMKKDKSSVSKFGRYIHTYKFDEAVEDNVILDLRYEARDVNQELKSKKEIDNWFANKTQGLNSIAKKRLKKRWATMQTVLSSANRIQRIVNDICLDIEQKARFLNGKGNAILVAGSIYEACIYYELFRKKNLDQVAVITSYKPNKKDVRDEYTGDKETDKMRVYEIYKKMLGDKSPEKFEEETKTLFKNNPDKLKLLIVVDKLLTGFDAPSATYLYIDKSMRDHGLFQAICRVNRLHDSSKEYGYIIDYMDLFMNLESAVKTYTSAAFDGFDAEDIKGLIKNRLEYAKKYLDRIFETLELLCESIKKPKSIEEYKNYFITLKSTTQKELKQEEKTKEKLRIKFYTLVSSFITAYTEIANEMQNVGYTKKEEKYIKNKIKHYKMMKNQIGLISGDLKDLKHFDGDMRNLIDTYIEADEVELISGLENLTLVELLVKKGDEFKEQTSKKDKKTQDNISEAIENNIRKLLIDKYASNPKFYNKLSFILEELILLRKQQTIDYKEYLDQIVELAKNAVSPQTTNDYPNTINTEGLRALYDNLDKNEELSLKIHQILLTKRPDGWKNNKSKTKILRNELNETLSPEKTDEILNIILNHPEYN